MTKKQKYYKIKLDKFLQKGVIIITAEELIERVKYTNESNTLRKLLRFPEVDERVLEAALERPFLDNEILEIMMNHPKMTANILDKIVTMTQDSTIIIKAIMHEKADETVLKSVLKKLNYMGYSYKGDASLFSNDEAKKILQVIINSPKVTPLVLQQATDIILRIINREPYDRDYTNMMISIINNPKVDESTLIRAIDNILTQTTNIQEDKQKNSDREKMLSSIANSNQVTTNILKRFFMYDATPTKVLIEAINSPKTDVNILELARNTSSYLEGIPEAVNHKVQELLKTRLENQNFKGQDDPLFKLLYMDTLYEPEESQSRK